jgi:hypothetical protein
MKILQILLAYLLLMLLSCSNDNSTFNTKITVEEIQKHPSIYDGKYLVVSGICVKCFNAFGIYKSYMLSDEKGYQLYVKSSRKITPAVGEIISARGYIKEILSWDRNLKILCLIESDMREK